MATPKLYCSSFSSFFEMLRTNSNSFRLGLNASHLFLHFSSTRSLCPCIVDSEGQSTPLNTVQMFKIFNIPFDWTVNRSFCCCSCFIEKLNHIITLFRPLCLALSTLERSNLLLFIQNLIITSNLYPVTSISTFILMYATSLTFQIFTTVQRGLKSNYRIVGRKNE